MRFPLIRADDQLALDVETFNLAAKRAGAGYELRPEDAAKPSFLVAIHSPQHILEYAATDGEPRKPQARPIFTDRTRVVYRIPVGAPPIPLSVAGILKAMRDLELVVDPLVGTQNPVKVPAATTTTTAALVAAAMAPAAPAKPGETARAQPGQLPTTGSAALLAEYEAGAQAHLGESDAAAVDPEPEASAAVVAASEDAATLPEDASATGDSPAGLTALNFPSELSISPKGGATRFAHATQPVVHGANVELWHSRLARLTTAGTLVERSVGFIARRAKAFADVNTPPSGFTDNEIRSPLDHGACVAIEFQTTKSKPIPRRATANRLVLSPLGAWLDASGSWLNATVQDWRHRLVMGRDQNVRLVTKGRLYPFGHQAVMTATMERRFTQKKNGGIAELFTTKFVHVTQPFVDYDGGATDETSRQWPWRSIELRTVETPPIATGAAATDFPRSPAEYFVPAGEPPGPDGKPNPADAFQFECLGVDRDGRVSTFEMPLVFVPDTFTNYSGLLSWFSNNAGAKSFRELALNNQPVALARADGANTPPDTTTVIAKTAGLAVKADGPLGYYPYVPYVDGVVPALARFAGQAGAKVLRVQLAEVYRKHGFDPAENRGELLLQFLGPVVDLAGAQTGGLVAPKFSIVGLSRQTGLVGGDPTKIAESLAQTALGKFDVTKWLSGALDSFKLFGIFTLSSLIPDNLDLKTNAPKMVTQALDGITSQELTWNVPLFGGDPKKEIRVGLARLRTRTGATSAATLSVQAIGSVDPVTGQVHHKTECRVNDVELIVEFGGDEMLTLPLEWISFRTGDGSKPDVDVQIGTPTFGGILEFIATLASLVDPKGFNDPPALEMLPDGVRSSFSTPIPAVAVGMFALENITFGAALSIYYTGKPVELALNFATFANPFRLTVAFLGGGGYFGLRVNTSGLQELAGALEFGAALSVNLGVARGSVSVMGGIYFKLEGPEATLTGYLRVRGELDVLGLISVGVEMMLALSYVSETKKVEGYAEMLVRVKLFFIRKTVRVEFHKQFAGANGDPTFAELMAPEDWSGSVLPWDHYCTAFAEA